MQPVWRARVASKIQPDSFRTDSMNRFVQALRRLSIVEFLGKRFAGVISKRSSRKTAFPGTAAYWDARYVEGGNSGAGSYGKFAQFKAQVLNDVFKRFGVRSVIEFGCGDGNQLKLLDVGDYTGVDISSEAVALCRRTFEGHGGRRFMTTAEYAASPSQFEADCALSLDVVYHLVEDRTFNLYMSDLFSAARRSVSGTGTTGPRRSGTSWPRAV